MYSFKYMIAGFYSSILLSLEEAKDKSSCSGWKFTFGESKCNWDYVKGQEMLGSQCALIVLQGLFPRLYTGAFSLDQRVTHW